MMLPAWPVWICRNTLAKFPKRRKTGPRVDYQPAPTPVQVEEEPSEEEAAKTFGESK